MGCIARGWYVTLFATNFARAVRLNGAVMKNNSQPQKSAVKVALVIIDMMNDLEFEGGEELYKNALPAAHHQVLRL